MKKLKFILGVILLTIISMCGFGGGFIVIGLPIIYIFKPSPIVCDIISFASVFIPIPFAWWIAPKLEEKL